MNASRVHVLILLLTLFSLPACDSFNGQARPEARRVTVLRVEPRPVTISHRYVGQINSHHHIMVRAPLPGRLKAIQFEAGQSVKQHDVLFQISEGLNDEQPDIETSGKIVPIEAPFDGDVGPCLVPLNSVVRSGDSLTTLSDNSLMWVYFKVPEVDCLEFDAEYRNQQQDRWTIDLILFNDKKFDQPGKLGSIGTGVDSKTGTVTFRADFENPDRKLSHGQRGTVQISRVQQDAIVIPQRATFEVLTKRYVYWLDSQDVAHAREVVVQSELDDQFVVKTGLVAGDRIVLDGCRLIRDGETVAYDQSQVSHSSADKQ